MGKVLALAHINKAGQDEAAADIENLRIAVIVQKLANSQDDVVFHQQIAGEAFEAAHHQPVFQ